MQNDLQLIENGTLDLWFLVKSSGIDSLKNWECSEIKCKGTP